MKIQRYDGAGNSFVIIDRRSDAVSLDTDRIVSLCQMQQTDGLLVLEQSNLAAYKMRYFNADGSETFCGNGARVLAFFAYKNGCLPEKKGKFEALGHIFEVKYQNEEWMIRFQNIQTKAIQKIFSGYFVNTGVPHYLEETEILDNLNLIQKAQPLRHHPMFEHGTNVSFFELKNHKIRLRTFERGVENETQACGTAAVALALVLGTEYAYQSPLHIQAKGGKLTVYFEHKEDHFTEIWLAGPVKFSPI